MGLEDSFWVIFASRMSRFFLPTVLGSPICRFFLLGRIFQASFVQLTELR